jgi:co-chaperonin GroES (HSP10)
VSDSKRIPFGGRIHVKLLQKDEIDHKSAGGIFLPDTAENTQDCEGIVLAVSHGPGYELPTWVAERLARELKRCVESPPVNEVHTARALIRWAAQPREPRVKVGDRVLFDITQATFAPDAPNEDEFFVGEDAIYAAIEDGPAVELTKLARDSAGYQVK